MAVKPVPDGYPQVIPYLSIAGAAKAIDFYVEVFGAKERMRMPGDAPDKVGHAELEIGDSIIMLSDASPEMGNPDPKAVGGTPVTTCLYIADVDAVFARAIKGGATEVRAVEDQFYGDRTGTFTDPWGHKWSVMTHVEDVSPEEMEKRMAAAMSAQ